MPREIEINLFGIKKAQAETSLRKAGAKLVGRYHFRRFDFQVTKISSRSINGYISGKRSAKSYRTTWVRVRTDGKRTTLTLKEQIGKDIRNRFEHEVSVSDFATTARIIHKIIPYSEYDYFESDRDEYELNGMNITIDKFPRLPYSMEIEGKSKSKILKLVERLGISGEKEYNKSMPTEKYYKMHGVDYGPIARTYAKKAAGLLKSR
ncbi:MAG: hypothetical protein LVQ97_00145 [Candidatus Micrarchaeales archaeon]|jgi:adenylate cyclase class 2|nr:hypothetical protein [Candidatus Micrarchaeales archaeon]